MNFSNNGCSSQDKTMAKRLGDVNKLYDLARDQTPESWAELSITVSSILEGEVSTREGELIADVLIKLVSQAENDLRCAVSEQVSKLDNAPLRLVLQLANDDIEVARKILKNSNILDDFDLMYIIKAKTSEYWQAIAERKILSDKVVDVLAETKDFPTALALVENENIRLTDNALVALSDIAQGSEVLATPLLRRDEVTSELAASLYEYVGVEIKKYISDNYEVNDEISGIVDNAVTELSTPEMPMEFVPDYYMIVAANSFKEKGLLNMNLMVSALRRGHIKSFIAQFSVYTGISVDDIGHALLQNNAKNLAAIAKVHNIQKKDFVSIFMMTGKIWNYGCVVDVRDIKAAVEFYNRITPEMAADILKK